MPLRVALAVLGLAVVAYLVRDVGPGRVLGVLWQAGPWLPLILALELLQLACDFLALRTILAERWTAVPMPAVLRSGMLAYAMMVLLPAGRAAGEITRATILSKHVGVARAAATSLRLQAAYLSANGVASAVAYAVVALRFGFGSTLALLLAGNVAFQAVVSAGLVAILWDGRLGRWLDRQRHRFARGPASIPPASAPDADGAPQGRIPWRASLICCFARALQVLQYGVILCAVGGHLTTAGAVIAHGIHLVGSTLGDFLPNQLGVVDGVYRAFAVDLGFATEPQRALSIALVARIAQLMCAAAAVLLAAAVRAVVARPAASPWPAPRNREAREPVRASDRL
jgi:hypothetical protein